MPVAVSRTATPRRPPLASSILASSPLSRLVASVTVWARDGAIRAADADARNCRLVISVVVMVLVQGTVGGC